MANTSARASAPSTALSATLQDAAASADLRITIYPDRMTIWEGPRAELEAELITTLPEQGPNDQRFVRWESDGWEYAMRRAAHPDATTRIAAGRATDWWLLIRGRAGRWIWGDREVIRLQRELEKAQQERLLGRGIVDFALADGAARARGDESFQGFLSAVLPRSKRRLSGSAKRGRHHV